MTKKRRKTSRTSRRLNHVTEAILRKKNLGRMMMTLTDLSTKWRMLTKMTTTIILALQMMMTTFRNTLVMEQDKSKRLEVTSTTMKTLISLNPYQ